VTTFKMNQATVATLTVFRTDQPEGAGAQADGDGAGANADGDGAGAQVDGDGAGAQPEDGT
jgi:hypothetical protein